MAAFDEKEPVAVFATLVAGAVLKYIFSAVIRSCRGRDYELVGEVASLTCYPIKSCGGFNVTAGDCTNIGLRVEGNVIDRHWVVTDAKYMLLSSGQMPRLSLVSTDVQGDQLIVNAPDMPTLKLPTTPAVIRDRVVSCNLGPAAPKCSELEGLDCGDEAAAWFSRFLSRDGVRLMHSAPGLKKRDVSLEEKAWGNPAKKGDQAAFSDFCAYLIMTESSQDAMNENTPEKISLRNFRPTIVLKGTKPYEEDQWDSVKIGDKAVLRTLYCTPRCIKVNVDHTTGERMKGREPLEQLKKFRCFPKFGRSPILGISSALDCGGRIRVGDPVYARRGRGAL